REVKPDSADGTAFCGRVGRRQPYNKHPVYRKIDGVFCVWGYGVGSPSANVFVTQKTLKRRKGSQRKGECD
ncbi:MAG: hypothetical protein KBG80_10840, partial [Breznakibacter sp.]|nr:hypothetical protein [Breznakibacter sp.]